MRPVWSGFTQGKGLASRVISGVSPRTRGTFLGGSRNPVNIGVKRGPNQVADSNSHPSPTHRRRRDVQLRRFQAAHRGCWRRQGAQASRSKSVWDEHLTNNSGEDSKGSEKFNRRETCLALSNPTFSNIIGN